MAETRVRNTGYDWVILIPVIVLLCFGLVLVYSASSSLAAHRLGDGYFYLKRQSLFVLLGLLLMIIAKNLPSGLYARLSYPALFVSGGLLALLLIPGFGHAVNHSSRWLRVGAFSLQPSELAKISLALYMAYSMSRKGQEMASFSRGLVPHLTVCGAFMVLIVLQPDLGTTVVIGGWVLLLLFIAGARWRYLFAFVILFGGSVSWLISQADYRVKRWLTFLNPWEDPQGSGFQIIHSFLAFGSGGVLGAGLGNSKQKLFYLPEPHTDFIFSIAGEELGFVGALGIILLFGVLILRGFQVALRARDLHSSYLALSMSSLIGLQVLINLGVVTGLLPTKGLTLPLISYGGSSLVANLVAVGVVLNVASRE